MSPTPTKAFLSLTERFDQVQAEVKLWIDKLLPEEEDSHFEQPLIDAMRYAMLNGGKRVRPFLLLETAKLYNVNQLWAIRAACALEMVHCFSLVHDDLPAMDNAHLRRGKPAAHIAFDEATAILAGDALLTKAFKILAQDDTHPDPKVRAELILCLTKATGVRGMCGGQMMDIMSENSQLDMASIIRLQRLKTGCLLEASCILGAILGNAPVEARKALQGYAHDLGLAYQITDDLLDAEGSDEEIGKPVGTNALLGKANLVALMGPQEAREHAEMLVSQALIHLDYFGEKAHYLKELARHIVNRRT